MSSLDPQELDALRGLIHNVESCCEEAKVVRRRIESRMRRPPVWPDRRQPRRWDESRDDAESNG
jgi:hypothetical protein